MVGLDLFYSLILYLVNDPRPELIKLYIRCKRYGKISLTSALKLHVSFDIEILP